MYQLGPVPDPRQNSYRVTMDSPEGDREPDEDGSVRHLRLRRKTTDIPDQPPPLFTDLDSHRDLHQAPTQDVALEALSDLKILLQGASRGQSGGYKHPDFDPWVQQRLNGIRALLEFYTSKKSKTHNQWDESLLQAAVSLGRGTHCARID